MTLIEITLLIVIFIFIFILINQDNLISIFTSQRAKNKVEIDILLEFFKKTYSIFRIARRFSLVYILRNKFYKYYLVIAIGVVSTKIFLHYNTQTIDSLPVWINKIVDFLIISSAWEIICIFTKIIDEKTSKK